MAAAAVRILRDDARWREMSTLAEGDARERFSLDDIVGRYEAFYDEKLGTVAR
jgi:hypothetical protein